MPSTKQNIAALLRRMHLLQLADDVLLLRDIVRNRKANQQFLAAHPDFAPPRPNILPMMPTTTMGNPDSYQLEQEVWVVGKKSA